FHRRQPLFLTSSIPDFRLLKAHLVSTTRHIPFLSLRSTYEASTILVNSTIFWMISLMKTSPLSVYKKPNSKNQMPTLCFNHSFLRTTLTTDIKHIGALTPSILPVVSVLLSPHSSQSIYKEYIATKAVSSL